MMESFGGGLRKARVPIIRTRIRRTSRPEIDIDRHRQPFAEAAHVRHNRRIALADANMIFGARAIGLFDAGALRGRLYSATHGRLQVPASPVWSLCIPVSRPRHTLTSIQGWSPALEQALHPGVFGLLAPGRAYAARWMSPGNCSFIVVDLSANAVAAALREVQQGFHFDAEMSGLLQSQNPEPDEAHMFRLASCALRAIEHPDFLGAGELDWAIRMVLQTTPPGELSVPGLARRLKCSAGHLSRRCSRELGRSPYDMILAWRLDRARRLLAHTDWPLAAIAAETGFCDQSHLGNSFTRVLGVSPGRLRRASALDQESARPARLRMKD
jgi:AraC-like DNA-binding protein